MKGRLVVGYSVLVVGIVLTAALSWYYVSNAISSNERLLKIILAVTDCAVDDTPEQCAQRQAIRSREEGAERLVVVDCLVRRALANKPSPVPGEVCRL